MSTAALSRRAPSPPTLDFDLVRKFFLGFAAIFAFVAPFTPEPMVTIVGAVVPWVLLSIIGTPTMPAAVMYIFLWQWMQVYTRVPLSWIDHETLSTGLFGPDVGRAYWYMLASLVVMAGAFRAVLGNLKPPTRWQLTAHYRWQLTDLLMVYGLSMAISIAASFAIRSVPALAQILDAVARLKVIGLFMLFTYCMSTGRGQTMMLGVILFEIAVGFTGFLSDFRGVFVYLAIAAVAARVKFRLTTGLATAAGVAGLVALALFWTSVKTEYRNYAAQSDESQNIKVPLSERMAYLGERALSSKDMNLSETSYALLSRLAYVDIFGSVIGVQTASPEPIPLRQWSEALGHVLQPRFLFPNKAALSDTDVYMRLARAMTNDEIRAGTSISVGYMAENYADLGFPGMLIGIAILGLLLATVIRALLNYPLPQIMRDGIIMGFAFSMARDGVEVSLPKILGGMMMFFIVSIVLCKFAYPRVVQWLDNRAAAIGSRSSRLKPS